MAKQLYLQLKYVCSSISSHLLKVNREDVVYSTKQKKSVNVKKQSCYQCSIAT